MDFQELMPLLMMMMFAGGMGGKKKGQGQPQQQQPAAGGQPGAGGPIQQQPQPDNMNPTNPGSQFFNPLMGGGGLGGRGTVDAPWSNQNAQMNTAMHQPMQGGAPAAQGGAGIGQGFNGALGQFTQGAQNQAGMYDHQQGQPGHQSGLVDFGLGGLLGGVSHEGPMASILPSLALYHALGMHQR